VDKTMIVYLKQSAKHSQHIDFIMAAIGIIYSFGAQLSQTLSGVLAFLFSGQLKTNLTETQNPIAHDARPGGLRVLFEW
jgi:hypothetical protein